MLYKLCFASISFFICKSFYRYNWVIPNAMLSLFVDNAICYFTLWISRFPLFSLICYWWHWTNMKTIFHHKFSPRHTLFILSIRTIILVTLSHISLSSLTVTCSAFECIFVFIFTIFCDSQLKGILLWIVRIGSLLSMVLFRHPAEKQLNLWSMCLNAS